MITLLAVGAQALADDGVRVTGTPGVGGWPFSNITEGHVICRGQPPTLPVEPPWFVFFEAPGGQLLALNGKAQTAVDNGRVAGRNLHAELQAASAGAAPFVLMGQWIKAGVALCKGERAEAERLAAEASRIAAEQRHPSHLPVEDGADELQAELDPEQQPGGTLGSPAHAGIIPATDGRVEPRRFWPQERSIAVQQISEVKSFAELKYKNSDGTYGTQWTTRQFRQQRHAGERAAPPSNKVQAMLFKQ